MIGILETTSALAAAVPLDWPLLLLCLEFLFFLVVVNVLAARQQAEEFAQGYVRVSTPECDDLLCGGTSVLVRIVKSPVRSNRSRQG